MAQDPATFPPPGSYTDKDNDTHPTMILQTPASIQHLLYLGVDTKATNGDELLGLGLGRLYLGLYPTATGFELAYGVVNSQGCL